MIQWLLCIFSTFYIHLLYFHKCMKSRYSNFRDFGSLCSIYKLIMLYYKTLRISLQDYFCKIYHQQLSFYIHLLNLNKNTQVIYGSLQKTLPKWLLLFQKTFMFIRIFLTYNNSLRYWCMQVLRIHDSHQIISLIFK